MHLPASVGGINPPADPLGALKQYSALGLRCFPATYLDKSPHPRVGKWGTFLTLPPVRPDMWDALVDGWGRFNVALITDEHLVVIDLDNLDFAAWFDAQGPERLGTWVVRSPSGGLHVYAYSDDPQRTTVIKATNGVKIGDVKARGGYVIAPPSVGPNGDYQTEYGSPDAVARHTNVVTWFKGFVEAWEKTLPIRLQPAMNDAPEYVDGSVHGAPPDTRQDEILGGLRTAWMDGSLNRKVYDTLVAGVDAADGYWKNPDDRSDVDFGCVKEMIGLGWTFPEIEEAWTFLPVGERYRSDARNHGHGYLLRTYDNAKRKWDADAILRMNAVGGNFSVQQPVERFIENNETHYSFGLQHTVRPDKPIIRITCPATAFLTPAAFLKVCYQQDHFADLGNFDSKKALRALAETVHSLAVERELPETATFEGGLRIRIRDYLSNFMTREMKPDEEPENYVRVWTQGEYVFARSQDLMRYMEALREVPKRIHVWNEWMRLGGSQSNRFGSNVWRMPKKSLTS